MTTPSDLAGWIIKHADMAAAERLMNRRANIGTAIGAGAGAGIGALRAHMKNKDLPKGKKHSVLGSAAVHGAVGGFAGRVAGAASAAGHVARASRAHYEEEFSGWGRGGGHSAPKSGGAGHPFWSKIKNEKVRRQAQGVAAHAKKTQGAEGEAAKGILKNMAKKHGFSAEDAIKHASFALHAAILGR